MKLPYAKGSETSFLAANSAKETAATGRRRVFEFIDGCGPDGATDDDVQRGLAMPGDTQRPRRGELVKAGLVVAAGRTRRTRSDHKAGVWVSKRWAPRNSFVCQADEPKKTRPCPACAGRGKIEVKEDTETMELWR